MDKIQESILKAIDIVVEQKIKDIKADITLTGKVKTDHGSGLYTVTINDYDTQIKARAGLTLVVGDIVYVRLVQGNFSEKFIDCKRP